MMKKPFNERWSETNNLLTYFYKFDNKLFDIYLKTFYPFQKYIRTIQLYRKM